MAGGSRLAPDALSRSFGFERLDAGAAVASARARAEWAGGGF
jgi:hypothetical protein